MRSREITNVFNNIDFVASSNIIDFEGEKIIRVECAESPERFAEVIGSLEREKNISKIENIPRDLNEWSKDKNKFIYFEL